MFSKLVIVVLLAVTIGFYLKIVMLDKQPVSKEPIQQASVQVVEGSTAAAPAKDLPDDQMRIIKQVFSPELIK